jgi:hypothetical protein
MNTIEKMIDSTNRYVAKSAFASRLFQDFFHASNSTGVDKASDSRVVMKHLARLFSDLTPREQMEWQAKALEHRRYRLLALREDRYNIEAELEILDDRMNEEASQGIANTMANFRFSQSDFEEVSDKLKGLRPNDWRHRDDPPLAPPVDVQQIFLMMERELGLHDPKQRPVRWWLKYVTDARDRWQCCALYAREKPDTAYLFLHASERPRVATFLELRRTPSAFLAYQNCGTPLPAIFQEFEYLPVCFRDTDTVLDMDDGDLLVYPAVYFRGLLAITSHAPVEFDEFILPFLPNISRTKAQKEAVSAHDKVRLPVAAIEKLLIEFPWLSEQDIAAMKAPRKLCGVKGPR